MAELYLRYIECSLPFIFHFLLCILAYLFWASLVSVVIPIFLAYQVIRWLEVAWISHQRIGTHFSLPDLPFALESEDNPNYINALITLHGPADVDGLRKLVNEKIIEKKEDKSYRRMRQFIKKTLNTCVWCDVEDFDISKQIPVFDGKPPKNQKELEECFSALCNKSVPPYQSPWQFVVIPLHFKGEEKFAVHIQIHHCMGDGFSLVGLLSQIVDEKPKFIKPKKHQGYMTNPVKRYLRGLCTGPLSLLVIALSSYVKNPFATNESPITKKVAWTHSIPLETIKKIKTITGTTVNDVLVSCLAGAIREYLQKNGIDNPEDHPISMTFNSRSLSHRAVESIPLGNNSGASFLSLPVSIGDPLKRLELSKSRIDKMKQSFDPHLFSFVFQYLIALLPLPFTKMTTFQIKKHCSLIFSNVPGPLEPLSIGGKRMDSVMVIPPLVGNMGLVMAIFSYAGKIRLTILSNESVMAKPSELTEVFENEIKLLCERVEIKY